jgi:DHA2 family multidrug resistance protein
MAVYLPALAGAPLGGLLTAWATWRLIFLINLPLGSAIAATAWTLLPPDRPATAGGSFDWLGLALLVAVVVPLNVTLDMGQYWGWLASPYFVPWLAALVTGLILFVSWGVLADAPLIGLRPLAVRHFALGLGIKVLFSINLYLMVGLLSGYMINLRGYQWWQGSLVLLPGLLTMLLGVLVGTWLGTDGNRKLRMFGGLSLMALATWQLSTVDVYTAKGWQALMTAVWGLGAGVVCGPALLTTFEGLSNEATLQTAGVFNIMRSLPTFVAAGLLATLLTQRTDTNFDWLRLNMRDERPVVVESLRGPADHFVNRGSGDATAAKQSHALLGQWTHANARGLAFRDVFQMLTLAPLFGLVLVLMLRIPPRSAAV